MVQIKMDCCCAYTHEKVWELCKMSLRVSGTPWLYRQWTLVWEQMQVPQERCRVLVQRLGALSQGTVFCLRVLSPIWRFWICVEWFCGIGLVVLSLFHSEVSLDQHQQSWCHKTEQGNCTLELGLLVCTSLNCIRREEENQPWQPLTTTESNWTCAWEFRWMGIAES